MKLKLKSVISVVLLFLASIAYSQYVTIPDTIFRNVLSTKYPDCFNASMQMDTTCSAIVNETELLVYRKNISDITGIRYFDKLKQLNCNSNKLTFLPLLPDSIQALFCVENRISKITSFPEKLTQLYASENNLSSLPDLPDQLLYLQLDRNPLKTLPPLPDKLIGLFCSGYSLTQLPTLPKTLKILACQMNVLTSLPDLPESLEALDCSDNKLKEIPTLPRKLKKLSCAHNQLTVLPVFPDSLQDLNCRSNKLMSIPPFPRNLIKLDIGSNLVTTVPNFPSGLQSLICDNNDALLSLPALPVSLQSLTISGFWITREKKFPVIPADVFFIDKSHALGYFSTTEEIKDDLIEAIDDHLFRVFQKPTFNDSVGFDNYVTKVMKPYHEFNKKKLSDTVTVQFIIDENGGVFNIGIRKGKYQILNEEAIRIIQATDKKWIPYIEKGLVRKCIINRNVIFKYKK
jgi:hypothetical protein